MPLIHAAAVLKCILYSTITRLQQDLSLGDHERFKVLLHTLICAAAEGRGLVLNLKNTTEELCQVKSLHLTAPQESPVMLLHFTYRHHRGT